MIEHSIEKPLACQLDLGSLVDVVRKQSPDLLFTERPAELLAHN